MVDKDTTIMTAQIILKYLITAGIIVAVTEVQKVNDRLSALLIALPITSLIAMVWMHYEKQEPTRIANHAEMTFWFVLPTMPMFLLLPWMLRQGMGFWSALGLNCLITIGLFYLTVWIGKKFGLELF